jgi:Uma2 family endonuclease
MTIARQPSPALDPIQPDIFPAPPTDLPYDDGEPLETPRHRSAMNLLIHSLDHYWIQRNDYYVGGNMFLYYSATQAKNQDFRGPDFFVALEADRTGDRKYWAIWDEGGKYPDVIVELMSDSTAAIDQGEKKHLYERTFKTANYFVYDPYNPQSLQGWQLGQNQRYQAIQPNNQGWLWCEPLELWLGLWEGSIDRETALWLRFYDANEKLVLLAEEAAEQKAEQAEQKAEQAEQKAEQERLRAERLAEQLRALGVSPDL